LQAIKQGDRLTFADGTSVIINCQVDKFKLSAHSDQGQLLSVIKQVNPKALALVHGEEYALSALRERLEKDYSVCCPLNGEMIEGTDTSELVSPEKQEQLEEKKVVEFDVEITDTGVVLDECILSSQQWKEFADGEHTVMLKDDQLIIHKRCKVSMFKRSLR